MTLLKRGLLVTPNGSQTRSKSVVNYPGLDFPYVSTSSGSRITTTDGNEYVDLVCGMGASILGYGHPGIVKAITKQACQGNIYGLPHRAEVEVSERFLSSIGGDFESVRWVKTGSEACAAAMRVARRATGREIIVTSDQSYHGWHDGFIASKKNNHPGIPEALTDSIITFKYNYISDLERILEENNGKVAAVMMEACLYEKPAIDFLVQVKKLAHEFGALFILDEMILGFRLACGGGQEYFDIKSDLACYGKAIAGGYPLACLVGSRNLMKYADVVSGTFGGEVSGLVACNAVMNIYREEETIENICNIGINIRHYICSTGIKYNLPFTLSFYDSVFRINWTGEHSIKLRMLFVKCLIEQGVLMHPLVIFPSTALSKIDLMRIERAIDIACKVCMESLDSNIWPSEISKIEISKQRNL